MTEANLTVIQIDNMPNLGNLLPTSIYYVRNKGIIIETDENAVPKLFGLLDTYPDANIPLSDTDKLLVRQGDEWKEVGKSELGDNENNLITLQWSGRWKLPKSKNDFSIFSTVYCANYPNNSTINGYNDTSILLYPYNKGWIMPANGKLKDFIIAARSAYLDSDMRVKIIRQWYTPNNNGDLIINGEVIHESIMQISKYKANHYEVNVNSDIVCNKGDNITIVTNVVNDSNYDRYLYNAQFMLNFKKVV